MSVTEEVARSLAGKLQAFAATLPAEEQEALARMLRAYGATVEDALSGASVLDDEEGLAAAREALSAGAGTDGGTITVITTITVLQTSKYLCKPKD